MRLVRGSMWGLATMVVLVVGVTIAAGPASKPWEVGAVARLAALFLPWGMFAGWVSLRPHRSVVRHAGVVALVWTAIGTSAAAYHVDEPRSLLCALEWLGLPGWRLAARLHEPIAGAVVLYSSPLVWVALLSWAGRWRFVRERVLLVPPEVQRTECST